ncbi:MAG: hypothetical protein LBM23_10745 [Propionibacteriaceae bacterium]|nr:hypothetical protein [Propionibacteriaceae bacterium]
MTTNTSARPTRERPRCLTRDGAIDGGVAFVVLVAALVGFQPVMGGATVIRPVAIGLIAGAIIAWLGAWQRWATYLVGLATIGAYLLLGSAAAYPDHSIGGIVPTATSLRGIVFGAVDVWKQFVTASNPVSVFTGLGLLPFIIALVGSVATFTAVWRAKRAPIALIPITLTVIVVIAFGIVYAFHPILLGLVFLVVVLPWLAWRARQVETGEVGRSVARSTVGHDGEDRVKEARAAWLTKLRDGAILLLAAGLVAALAGAALDGATPRVVIRSYVEPPLDLRAYASPLVGFRSYVDPRTGAEGEEDEGLFTVTGWSGEVTEGWRLRLAVMDDYDGMVYRASRTERYERVSPQLGLLDEDLEGERVDIGIAVDGYSDVWTPGLSHLDSLTFTGARADDLTEHLYYNDDADALVNDLDSRGLTRGDTYVVSSVVSAPSVSDLEGAAISTVRQPEPQAVPDEVGALASQFAGDAREPLARVQAIVDRLRTDGFFSHGLEQQPPSKPGHSASRIKTLLSDPTRMVGDDEQYAVAACLMLRELGLPCRVVMGFVVSDGEGGSTPSQIDGDVWTVTGTDVAAWIEVPFDGFGWVAFDPTPQEDKTTIEPIPMQRPDPKPQILQPPPPPDEPPPEEPESVPEDRDNEDGELPRAIDWALIGRIAAAIGIPLILLLGPPLIIVALKIRRRRRRRAEADTSICVAGGWKEVADRAADLGSVFPAHITRQQAGHHLAQTYDVAQIDDLAARADRGAFAPAPPTSDEVSAYWTDVQQACGAMGSNLSRWKRLKARISPRSLRKKRTATVLVERAA